jgi:DNA polymerase sigma
MNKSSNNLSEEEEDFLQFDSSSDETNPKIIHLTNKDKYPWMKSSKKVENTSIKLHIEIMEFYNYISPTEQDIQKRRKIFEDIRKIVKVFIILIY